MAACTLRPVVNAINNRFRLEQTVNMLSSAVRLRRALTMLFLATTITVSLHKPRQLGLDQHIFESVGLRPNIDRQDSLATAATHRPLQTAADHFDEPNMRRLSVEGFAKV